MYTIVCFHNPDEMNGYMSNWFLSVFVVDGVKYTSAEQYMMYQKALLFGDYVIAEKIMETDKVGLIKALGRQVSPYDDERWRQERYLIVYKGVLEKFRQNEELKRQILNTGDALLAECAVRDTIWGIGLSMKDERRLDPAKWQGSNLLGKVLMQVRDVLRQEQV